MNGERTIMAEKQRVIALGFFDGVHRGHGALLRTARELADERGAIAAAVTFDHHPRDLIRGEPTPLINTHQERAVIMKRYYGTDEVLVLPFDRAMMEMPWRLAYSFRAFHWAKKRNCTPFQKRMESESSPASSSTAWGWRSRMGSGHWDQGAPS